MTNFKTLAFFILYHQKIKYWQFAKQIFSVNITTKLSLNALSC